MNRLNNITLNRDQAIKRIKELSHPIRQHLHDNWLRSLSNDQLFERLRILETEASRWSRGYVPAKQQTKEQANEQWRKQYAVVSGGNV